MGTYLIPIYLPTSIDFDQRFNISFTENLLIGSIHHSIHFPDIGSKTSVTITTTDCY